MGHTGVSWLVAQRVTNVEDVNMAMRTEKAAEDPRKIIQECMEAWQRKMGHCVRLQWDCFERENSKSVIWVYISFVISVLELF